MCYYYYYYYYYCFFIIYSHYYIYLYLLALSDNLNLKMGKGGENLKQVDHKAEIYDNSYSKILVPPTSGGIHRTDFYQSTTDEPHATRRKEILQKYPEIESLFGPDIRPLPFVILIMMSQLYLGYLSKNWSNGFFFLGII